MDINQAKQAVREEVWSRLEHAAVVPPGVRGHIPDFIGAQEAAAHLASLTQWQTSEVIKCNPDRAQLPVRTLALTENKLVYMAVPKIADIRPFYVLNPASLTAPIIEAATSTGASVHAPKTAINDMQPVDMVICGSVAVNRKGVRIGKGAGYSDIEVALLFEANLIGPATTFVTTVHSLQVVADELPAAPHDFAVDFIITPDGIIECSPDRRITGIDWPSLSMDKIEAIPPLKHLITTKTDS